MPLAAAIGRGWRQVPTWGAVLRAVHLPEVGGDTIWVDAGAAFDGLSDSVKARFALG